MAQRASGDPAELRESVELQESTVAPTPLPKVRAYLIGLILLSNGFSSMVIFPFIPFMVHDFFPSYGKDALGYKVGLLGSAYFAGSFCGSIMWGFLSDKIGRRPCLLCGICGTIVAVLLFGFAETFPMAVASRALWGLLNGNIGVAKTYMAEICDDTNQAQGMALIAAQGGFGRLLGPVLGGFLARRRVGVALLDDHPYALPCLIGVLLAACALAGACALLEETLPPAERVRPAVAAAEAAEALRQCAARCVASVRSRACFGRPGGPGRRDSGSGSSSGSGWHRVRNKARSSLAASIRRQKQPKRPRAAARRSLQYAPVSQRTGGVSADLELETGQGGGGGQF